MTNQDYKPFYRYNHGRWEGLSQEEQDEYGGLGLFILWLQSVCIWLKSMAVFVIMALVMIILLKGCIA